MFWFSVINKISGLVSATSIYANIIIIILLARNKGNQSEENNQLIKLGSYAVLNNVCLLMKFNFHSKLKSTPVPEGN